MHRLLTIVVTCTVLGTWAPAARSQQQTPQAVPPERGGPIVERAIQDARDRLAALEALQARLDANEPVSREEFREALGQSEAGRPDRPAGGPGALDRGPTGDRPEERRGERPPPPLSPPTDPQWDLPWAELDEEHQMRVRGFLQEHAPIAYSRLEQSDGPIAERILGRALAPRAIRVIRAQDTDEQLGKLSIEEFKAGVGLFEAGRLLREAFVEKGEESDVFGQALEGFRESIGREIDAKYAIRAYEFRQLESRLAEQREALAAEAGKRDERIRESTEQVLARIKGQGRGRPSPGEEGGRGPRRERQPGGR